MWIVESSIPMAMMLLSWGWNARKVEAGGGDMKVVITYKANKSLSANLPKLTILTEHRSASIP